MKKTQNKHLKLSKDKKLLGVAGGIAEYFSLDKSLVRIIALIFIVMSGIIPGFIIYFIIGSVIMPDK
ncbi:MAG: PspC domain-containing protein [Candidatus Saccharibacteria bacterium]|jgi:phage shock protein C